MKDTTRESFSLCGVLGKRWAGEWNKIEFRTNDLGIMKEHFRHSGRLLFSHTIEFCALTDPGEWKWISFVHRMHHNQSVSPSVWVENWSANVTCSCVHQQRLLITPRSERAHLLSTSYRFFKGHLLISEILRCVTFSWNGCDRHSLASVASSTVVDD